MLIFLAKVRRWEEQLYQAGLTAKGVFLDCSSFPDAAMNVIRTSGGGPPDRRVSSSSRVGHWISWETPISTMWRCFPSCWSFSRGIAELRSLLCCLGSETMDLCHCIPFTVTSSLTGPIIIEDVIYEKNDDYISRLFPSKDVTFRRLKFERNEGLIQSEALLVRTGSQVSVDIGQKKTPLFEQKSKRKPQETRKKTSEAGEGNGCKRCNCKKTKCLKLKKTTEAGEGNGCKRCNCKKTKCLKLIMCLPSLLQQTRI